MSPAPTTARASRIRRAAVVVAAAVVALLGGCGVSPQSSPRNIGPVQFQLNETSTTSTTTTTTTLPATVPPSTAPPVTAKLDIVRIYLIRSPGRLVAVGRSVPRGTPPATVAQLLEAAPTAAEQRAGLRTALKPGTVKSVSVRGGTATIDVDPQFGEQLPIPVEQELQAAQLVMTLTDRGPGIGRVRFTTAGQPLNVPLADGSNPTAADGSVSRDDYRSILVRA
jgi:Sporulation and spore germination